MDLICTIADEIFLYGTNFWEDESGKVRICTISAKNSVYGTDLK